MFKNLKDQEIKRNILVLSLSGIIIVSFKMILLNLPVVKSWIKTLIDALSPFLWGLLFAVIMSSFSEFVEARLPEKIKHKTKRLISSIAAIVFLLAIIAIFILILFPQLGSSISSISTIVAGYVNNASAWFEQTGLNEYLSPDISQKLYEYANTLLNSLWQFIQGAIPSVLSITVSTFSSVFNFIIGFIVALYILIDREKLKAYFSKLFRAILTKDSYNYLHHATTLFVKKFYQFLVGKIIDSLIIGVICAIAMIVLKLEYVALISVVVFVTNIIPFFGPFLGAIPSCLLLLLVNPMHALIFMILILVLQQIDGNIIGPYILGDSVGLSSLGIIFAIMIGGAYFGFVGMLFGVPVFAVISILITDFIEKRTQEKSSLEN